MREKLLKESMLAMMTLLPLGAVAQDKVETSVGADLVSSYIWRGQDLGGVSIQPSVGIAYKGVSLSAWGSTSFSGDSGNDKELDVTLSYTTGGLTIGVTDYWSPGTGYFHYKAHETSHVWEANIGYDFGPLALNWYTNFAGNDGVNKNGKRAYSSYVEASVPFTLGGLDMDFTLGAVPYGTDFYNGADKGFAVSQVAIGAQKELKITDSFSLPVSGKAIWNPATEGAYLVFGITL